eukprot:227147-Amphidinium_carterae.1
MGSQSSYLKPSAGSSWFQMQLLWGSHCVRGDPGARYQSSTFHTCPPWLVSLGLLLPNHVFTCGAEMENVFFIPHTSHLLRNEFMLSCSGLPSCYSRISSLFCALLVRAMQELAVPLRWLC